MIGFIKQDFVKKGVANQNFRHKEGLEQKGGLKISYFEGGWGGWPKRRGDFFKWRVHTLVPTMLYNYL